jgi:hypothetical protein
MYYSYVEIEYVGTSFSPAGMDLALKLLTSRVSLRLANRPSAQFATSTNKNNLQASETATALLQVKEGYQPNKPPLWRK